MSTTSGLGCRKATVVPPNRDRDQCNHGVGTLMGFLGSRASRMPRTRTRTKTRNPRQTGQKALAVELINPTLNLALHKPGTDTAPGHLKRPIKKRDAAY